MGLQDLHFDWHITAKAFVEHPKVQALSDRWIERIHTGYKSAKGQGMADPEFPTAREVFR